MSSAKEHQFSYGAEVVRCHACAAMQRAGEKFQHDGGDPAGLQVRLTRTP